MDVIPKKGSGRLLETDRASGMARNFSCGYSGLLCGDEFTIMEDQMTDGDTVEFGDQIPVTCTSGEPQYCNGEQTGTGGSFNFSWESGTPAIAAISGESTFDYVNLLGVKAGTSTIQGQIRSETCETGGQGPQTVQVPTASRIVQTTTNAAATDCPTGYAGWNRMVTKIVTDQQNPPQDIVAANQSLTENVTTGSPNDLGIKSYKTGAALTNDSGNFNDRFEACSTACPKSTGTTVANQVITDVYNTSTYTLSPNIIVYSCKSITLNGQ